VFAHASWTAERSESYERLAFLGDSVLSLAVTTQLYPRLDAERLGAGGMTKIRAQAVSRRSCAEVAQRLGLDSRLRTAAPESAPAALSETQSVLAEVLEAVIGACFLAFGFKRTAAAVESAFAPQIEEALEGVADYKSTLQEQLARRGDVVAYVVEAELGPPHERTFEVVATVDGQEIGRGSGRSKKDAEMEAARAALEAEAD
jgi:ribonuclease-3